MGTGYRSDRGVSKVTFECSHSLVVPPSPEDTSQCPGEPEPSVRRDGDGPWARGQRGCGAASAALLSPGTTGHSDPFHLRPCPLANTIYSSLSKFHLLEPYLKNISSSYRKAFDVFYCLSELLDQKQCLSLQALRSKVPCGGQPGGSEPLLWAGEQRGRRGAGPGGDRSHLAHPHAAAGRLPGHFLRNANHALPYHIKPLIANDAFRVGGERLPPAGARGSVPGTFCRAAPSPSRAGGSREAWKCRRGYLRPSILGAVCPSRRRRPQRHLPLPRLLPRARETEPQPKPICGFSVRARWPCLGLWVLFRERSV